MLGALTGDNSLPLHPLHHAFVAATALGGEVHVASYDQVDIAGVALWSPPGRELFGTPGQIEAGWGHYTKKAPAALVE